MLYSQARYASSSCSGGAVAVASATVDPLEPTTQSSLRFVSELHGRLMRVDKICDLRELAQARAVSRFVGTATVRAQRLRFAVKRGSFK